MIPELVDANPDPMAEEPGTPVTAALLQPLMEIRDAFEDVVNVVKFNRDGNNAEVLNATTILEALSASASPRTLVLKRGVWEINANVDMSASNVRLVLEDGAILERLNTNTFKFPVNFEIRGQGQHFIGSLGFISFAVGSTQQLLPSWWGANPWSALNDDTDALLAWEQAVYDSQRKFEVMQRGHYNFDGAFGVRTPLIAYGVVVEQISDEMGGGGSGATIVVNGSNVRSEITYFFLSGLEVNSNHIRPGFGIINFGTGRFFLGSHLKGINCNTFGVHEVNLAGGARFENCFMENIKYNKLDEDPAITGGGADGFASYGCANVEHVSCRVKDFRRIAYVAEDNGGSNSSNIRWIRCVAEYAHDCDDTTDQFNGAFWWENANGGVCIDCLGINIGSGVGQASARVHGITVGSGITATCAFDIVGFRLLGNASVVSQGIAISVNDAYATITIQRARLQGVYRGLAIGAHPKSVDVDGLTVVDKTSTDGNSVPVMIGSTDTSTGFTYLSIRRLELENCNQSADTGSIFFSGTSHPANLNYKLADCHGVSHRMNSTPIRSIVVERSEVLFGTSSTTSFNAFHHHFSNSVFTLRTGSNAALARCNTTSRDNSMLFENCRINFTEANAYWQISGTDTNLTMIGGRVQGGGIRIILTGTYWAKFRGVTFYDYGTNGAIAAAGASAPTRGCFSVIGCDFERGSTAAFVPPLKKVTNSPTWANIVGCFTDADDITDWTTIDTNVFVKDSVEVGP